MPACTPDAAQAESGAQLAAKIAKTHYGLYSIRNMGDASFLPYSGWDRYLLVIQGRVFLMYMMDGMGNHPLNRGRRHGARIEDGMAEYDV
jgi:hypothetical protein